MMKRFKVKQLLLEVEHFLLSILLVVVLVFFGGCGHSDQVVESAPTVEQVALNFFGDSIVFNKNLYPDSIGAINYPGRFFDPLWPTKGLFYKEQLFAARLVTGLTSPPMSREQLYVSRYDLDSADFRRAKEYINYYELNRQQPLEDIELKIPPVMTGMTLANFRLRTGKDELFVRVRHHLKSAHLNVAEILLIDHEGSYFRYFFYLDARLNVVDWHMERGYSAVPI